MSLQRSQSLFLMCSPVELASVAATNSDLPTGHLPALAAIRNCMVSARLIGQCVQVKSEITRTDGGQQWITMRAHDRRLARAMQRKYSSRAKPHGLNPKISAAHFGILSKLGRAASSDDSTRFQDVASVSNMNS